MRRCDVVICFTDPDEIEYRLPLDLLDREIDRVEVDGVPFRRDMGETEWKVGEISADRLAAAESPMKSSLAQLKAEFERERRERRIADAAIFAAVVAVLLGIAIALVVPYAQADEIECEWTWKVAPSDRLNTESLQRIRKAEMQETAKRAFDALREWSAEHAVQPYEEPTYEAYYEPTYYEPTYYAPTYYAPSYANDFASQGVVYEDGTRYTWYSSNSAYHYRTPEWSVDGEGFYRDSDGYYVVASTDVPMGGTVDTPWGEGKVYDTGCDGGTVDMYTAF